ncbi:hypothetical protein D3C81_2171720 [compost metagenome]
MSVHEAQHLLHGKQHIFTIFRPDVAGDPPVIIPIEVERVVKMSDVAGFEILERREDHVFIAAAVFERFPSQQRTPVNPAPDVPH